LEHPPEKGAPRPPGGGGGGAWNLEYIRT